MANSVTGFDGLTPPKLLPAVGSFCPFVPFKMTVSGTTTSEAVTFSNIGTIRGAMIQALSSGNNVVTTDADVTWSGNVLTIADGSTFNLDESGQVIYGAVWGSSKT